MSKKHPEKVIPLHEAEPGRLPITAIRIDGGTQPRAYTDADVVADYADVMLNGTVFPSVIVFYDGLTYWLADGFHRVEAAKRAGLTDIAAEVRQGTQRDAILFSVGANANHGLRRTNADKRRAVERLLRDEEWAAWSDREIARKCAVHHELVGRVRKDLSGGIRQIAETRTVERGGSTYTMNTGNIGGKAEPVRYGQNEDDYQPEVPEVQVEEPKDSEYYAKKLKETTWHSDTPEGKREVALGGRGATVRHSHSGQIGKLLFISGNVAYVDTANGRKSYHWEYLKRIEGEAEPTSPAAQDEEVVTHPVIDDNTLYSVMPSDDPLVERARQAALQYIGNTKYELEDRIKGRQGGINRDVFYNFGGGELFLNYRDNGVPSSRHSYARNQIAIRLEIDKVETLYRFNAFHLLAWKLENTPPAADPIDYDAWNGGVASAALNTLVENEQNGNYKRDSKVTRAANEYEPQGFDACQTPAYALDPLIPYLDGHLTFWEPAAGEGLLVEALYDSDINDGTVVGVITSDILTGQNFFDYQPEHEWDCIVTNPPFSLKFPWLKRCYELGKPFALLLPVETLGTKTAQDMFREYGVEVILMDKRVNFKMPNKGWEGGGAQFPVAWFTWGLNIGSPLTFARLETNVDPE